MPRSVGNNQRVFVVSIERCLLSARGDLDSAEVWVKTIFARFTLRLVLVPGLDGSAFRIRVVQFLGPYTR